MRNNAAYLPESPIVYIILPKSIRNRASFPIFAGYRIRMKREILYQRIAGTIAWQTDTLFYILTGTDIRINQHLRTGNEIKREITVRIQP